jgi:hypothetical protein
LLHARRNPADRALALAAIQAKAQVLARRLSLPGRTALVVDNSLSALGSAQRLYHPLCLMEAIVHICVGTGAEVSCHYVGPEPRDGYLEAEGPSNLRRALVSALLQRPQLVIILSDGYENTRAGDVHQILSSTAVRTSGTVVLHLNPVPAAESGGVRTLSSELMTFALTTTEQLPLLALIGQGARDPKALAPLFDEIEAAVRQGNIQRIRLATRRLSLSAPQRA